MCLLRTQTPRGYFPDSRFCVGVKIFQSGAEIIQALFDVGAFNKPVPGTLSPAQSTVRTVQAILRQRVSFAETEGLLAFGKNHAGKVTGFNIPQAVFGIYVMVA